MIPDYQHADFGFHFAPPDDTDEWVVSPECFEAESMVGRVLMVLAVVAGSCGVPLAILSAVGLGR